jgi:glycosyltransferase involved in cell wall biosynthesis
MARTVTDCHPGDTGGAGRSGLTLAVGPFPPPVHGAAVIHAAVADSLGRACRVEPLDIGPGRARITRHVWRGVRTLSAVLRVIVAATSGARSLYLTADDGWGAVYGILILSVARLMRLRIAVHHHSFRYLTMPTKVMRTLISVAGRRALHVVLCERMGRDLAARYGPHIRTLVVDNAAFIDLPGSDSRELSGAAMSIRVGLLSNLSMDKGLDLFLTVLNDASEKGLAIVGHLAGPVGAKDDRRRIEIAREVLGDRLVYHGPLYGAEKDRFWSSIDVFVFPSRYASEAQPLVLLEALSRGIPVIAIRRGCIASDVGRGGVVLGSEVGFVPRTVELLARWASDAAVYRELSRAARGQAVDRRARAMPARAELERALSTVLP